jgi:RNA polymerase Rpb5, N-terminal domain
VLQEDLQMDLEGFIERYGAEPGKDDLTILAPKQDDPTEQVPQLLPSSLRCMPSSIRADPAHNVKVWCRMPLLRSFHAIICSKGEV